ncbi:hypothetical protein BOTBODRAFT_386418 [Botryobasidium botryosum FD-172 SS1]|uniref:Uncharacterized protein n=1 Tax=Botryobasidium botryosum (strain FD-172 SS1) TaxID=930990 RepID=A0A067N8H0_BOTB1|nr:hypothetical protein BOTBODRAFT_386418 [Botryobasidium botryosum FD-172 SS1]
MSQLKAVILMLTCFFILCNGQTTSLINVDDNDPRVQYFSPGPSNWIASTTSSSSLFQNTDHYTNVTGATVSFIFPGPMIQYWGNTDPSHGSCAIAIDGEYAETISSNGPGGAPPTLLFQRDDLDLQANHTIIITVASSTYPNICELDRFVSLLHCNISYIHNAFLHYTEVHISARFIYVKQPRFPQDPHHRTRCWHWRWCGFTRSHYRFRMLSPPSKTSPASFCAREPWGPVITCVRTRRSE